MIYSYTLIDTYQTCPRQAYERFWLKIPVPETPELKKGKETHKALERRLLFDHPLVEELAHLEPICAAIDSRGVPQVEVKLGVDRQLEKTGFFDNDVYLRSVLDVLLLSEDRTKGIIKDWKTGKNREAQKEPLQLMIFAAQAFAAVSELQNLTCLNVYTTNGTLGTAHHWTRAELPSLWRDIVPKIHEIEQAEFDQTWPEKPSALCGWCPVKNCQHNASP